MATSVYHEIRAALDAYLEAWDDVPKIGGALQVNWENTQFSKPQPNTTPWISTALLIADADGRTLGGTPYTRLDGIYHLNIFAPAGRGTMVADQLADSLMIRFKSGTSLSKNTTAVTLRTPFRAPGRTETDWYQIPVQVRWYHHTQEL